MSRKSKISSNNKNNSNRPFQLTNIQPITENQKKTFTEWNNGKHLFLHGSPGTGKTFLALYLGLHELQENNNFFSAQIYRSSLPGRNIGFLPGDTSQKIKVFEEPYRNICTELYNRGDAYEILKQKNFLNFDCTSFLRGITLDNSIVVVDEVQNMNFQELSTIITRAGKNSRYIFSGDYRQSDFVYSNEKQGLFDFMEIMKKMESFSFIEFNEEDIVRSGLVKEYIMAENEYFKHGNNN